VPKAGHHFAGFFGFTFRADRVCFFIHAHGDNLKFLSTLIAFIFIYRHNFISLFSLNLELEQANVNTYEAKVIIPSKLSKIHIYF